MTGAPQRRRAKFRGDCVASVAVLGVEVVVVGVEVVVGGAGAVAARRAEGGGGGGGGAISPRSAKGSGGGSRSVWRATATASVAVRLGRHGRCAKFKVASSVPEYEGI